MRLQPVVAAVRRHLGASGGGGGAGGESWWEGGREAGYLREDEINDAAAHLTAVSLSAAAVGEDALASRSH